MKYMKNFSVKIFLSIRYSSIHVLSLDYTVTGCAIPNCEECQSSSQSAMGECTKCAGVFVLDKGTCSDSKL